MSAPHPVPKRTTTSFSARRRVNEKIVRFSLSMGTFAVALTALAYLASFYPEIQRLQGVNQRALSQINCRDSSCDTTEYSTNQDTPPDYVIDIKSRYLIETPPSSTEKPPHFRWLDLSDLTFVRKFREPASYQTIDLEIWRLYSRQAIFKGRTVEIMVGYAEKAASKMIDTPTSLTPVVDSKLRDEADKVAHGLQRNAKIGSASKLSADGLEIVDATTGRVMYWGPWLPGFLSDGARFPAPGTSFHISEAEVYIVQTDINDRILATSLVRIGNLWWLATLATFVVFVTVGISRWLAKRFLRNYFILSSARAPDLEEALRQGEGQRTEFKRGVAFEGPGARGTDTDLLESIAAFANTNDGAIFLGVDDNRAVKGLKFDSKGRDTLEQRIKALVRHHIRPTPPIEIAFEEVRGLHVGKIVVARGTAQVYLLNGVIYIRDGSSDVRAQPEDLAKLIAEYGF